MRNEMLEMLELDLLESDGRVRTPGRRVGRGSAISRFYAFATRERNDYTLLTLGFLAVAEDIITLGQFVYSRGFSAFWSAQWIAALAVTLAWLAMGLFLIFLSGFKKVGDRTAAVLGSLYLLIGMLVYVVWCQRVLGSILRWEEFLGFLVLFAIAVVAGSFCILLSGARLLRMPSYGFCSLGLIMFALVARDFFYTQQVSWRFAEGALLTMLALATFVALYWMYQEDL